MSEVSLHILGNAGAAPPAGGACSSYLVEHEGTRLLLDCGPASLPYLRGVAGVWDLDGIVLSHMHTDHFLDLLAMNIALQIEARPEGRETHRVPVLAPPGGVATIDACFEALAVNVRGTTASRYRDVLDCREYDPADVTEIGSMRVSWVGPVKHATLAFGTRVQAGGATIAYTGDSAYCPEAVATGRGADLFLAECTLMDPGPGRATHMAAADTGRVAAESGCGRLLATHLRRTDSAWTEALSERIASELAGPFDVVTRGAVYRLPA